MSLGSLLSDDIETISIHRDNILAEMLQLYTDNPDIVQHRIIVQFVGEPGEDLGGLTKDLYTSLWAEIIRQYFDGEAAVVPFIPVQRHAECRANYTAVGRILAHTVALLNFVPPRLSRCTLMCLALGAAQVSSAS